MPTNAENLLTALKAATIGSDVNDILAQMQAANEYATARDKNGMSAENIITARGVFQVFADTMSKHRYAINQKRRQTIPNDLFEAALSENWDDVTACNYIPSAHHDVDYLLYAAIDKGAPTEFVENLIDLTGANVNGTGKDGELIIYAAATPSRLEVLQLLIQKGANRHAQGSLHKSILHQLAYHQADTAAQIYLQYLVETLGIAINVTDYNLNTLLHACAKHGNTSMFYLALSYRPDITLRNRDEMTCLDLARQTPIHDPFTPQHETDAIKTRKMEIFKLIKDYHKLLKKRSDILAAAQTKSVNLANLELNGHDLPYLQEVLDKENPESIDLSNNQLTDQHRDKLIELVARYPYLVEVKLTDNPLSAETVAEINKAISPATRMKTLLSEEVPDLELAHYLLKHDTSELPASHVRVEGWTVFHFAAYYNNQAVISVSKKGQELLTLTDDGENRNAFHIALSSDNEDLCCSILRQSQQALTPIVKKVGGQVYVGTHPLVTAVRRNMLTLVKFILSKMTVDTDEIKNSDTLLRTAAINQSVEMTEALLRYGLRLTQPEFDSLVEELPDSNESATLKRILKESLSELSYLYECIKENKPQKLQKDLRLHDIDPSATLDGKNRLLHTALTLKRLECAGVLIAEGTIKNEAEEELIARLTDSEKIELRNASLKYYSREPQAIVGYFESRTRFVGGRRAQRERIKIRHLFNWIFHEEVSELGEQYLLPILEIIENSPSKVDIILDFNNDHVENMNPASSKTARGVVMHRQGIIYVGAKREINGIRGTLMHELCHLALQLVYQNDCDPYTKCNPAHTKLRDELLSNKNTLQSAFQKSIEENNGENPADIMATEIINFMQTPPQDKEEEMLAALKQELITNESVVHDISNRVFKENSSEGGAADLIMRFIGFIKSEKNDVNERFDQLKIELLTQEGSLFNIIRRALNPKGVNKADGPAVFIAHLINSANQSSINNETLYNVIQKAFMQSNEEIFIVESVTHIAHLIQELGQTPNNKAYTKSKKKLYFKAEDLHDISQRAFTAYRPEDHASELIVRVAHLIAEHEQEGEEILCKEAPELLKFYRDIVLPDMKAKILQFELDHFSVEMEEAGLSNLSDVANSGPVPQSKLSQLGLMGQLNTKDGAAPTEKRTAQVSM